MDDCGGFGLIGFLMLYIFGCVMGACPLTGAIVLGVTYVSLGGIS